MFFANRRRACKKARRKGFKKGYALSKKECAEEIKLIRKQCEEELARANQKIRLRDKRLQKIDSSTESLHSIIPALKYIQSELESDADLYRDILGDRISSKKKLSEKLEPVIRKIELKYPKIQKDIEDYNKQKMKDTINDKGQNE